MLRPIAPFVEYAVSYDYISKVLCINKDKLELQCNGKCQLMKKIGKQQDDDFKSLRIVAEDYPIGFVEITQLQLTKAADIVKSNFFYFTKYAFLFAYSEFHPPTI
ncbi:conserved protein of unknown function [Tenacibaculum soleae]|uniref:hypothetical protein n=1 Tax=Tenacibaculum soleae TaxID=447689 RepID=UPI003AB57186